ncbi:Cytochrome b6-f complex iron-sulfur subunit [Streptomyces sp. RB5]|uniref:Cytochrome bc1 complex Rieske iron-sulfur subunit n=1 Tax=Streptomyces smaragdinus TaxID=2585196 RepID=A0A7K0CG03_9ACTN|nr:Rieske (2Fe-2S) protein [Streptomyces smaragdinus]MQY12405.1 Cytochrome b6-f complex iron-sulfur subunit [Streptomyces smaragdinus]
MTDPTSGTPRRTVLCGAAAALLTTGAATACSTETPAHQENTGPRGDIDLGDPEAVPVGGAKLYRTERVIVSRPKADVYEGRSAVCTHQACVVTEVNGTEAYCACHGSRFDATNGDVRHGPASVPLPPIPVGVRGGKLIATRA